MDNKRELLVLYIDHEDGKFHEVLLNELEIATIASEITKIFAAKKSPVMVSEIPLRLFKEVDNSNGKRNSSKI